MSAGAGCPWLAKLDTVVAELGPLGPHTLENVGREELRVVSVELKGG